MAEKPTLLPPSSTPVERKLAQVCADIEAVPLPLRALRRAATTPDLLLPWLAWERSVDRWDDGWSAPAQRRAIAQAFVIHKHKGTVGALRRVVEPLGYLLEVLEWWQQVPVGPRGTFSLALGLRDSGISPEIYVELERLIDVTKRLSQHLSGLAISADVQGAMRVCLAAYDGETLTVYPYEAEPVEVALPLHAGLQDHTIDTLAVYPS